MVNHCESCRYWALVGDDHSDVSRAFDGAGQCLMINKSAGYGLTDDEAHPNIVVEDDEGWGLFVGPKFGCVLWEGKS